MLTPVHGAPNANCLATEGGLTQSVYVKTSAVVIAELPPAVVITTFTVPVACAGLTALIWVSESIWKAGLGTPLKLTLVAKLNPLPVTLTSAPPHRGPRTGWRRPTDGAGAA